MYFSNLFFKALKMDPDDKPSIKKFSNSIGIPLQRLNHYNDTHTIPVGSDLQLIIDFTQITFQELMLRMGVIDSEIISAIQQNANQVYLIIKNSCGENKTMKAIPPMVFKTESGKLYQGDCLDLMQHLESDTIDLIFADPPFNLNKIYPSKIDDNLKSEHYLEWCEKWASACIRILKPGGSFFIWNLPKWNTVMSSFLNKRLTFRNWITVDIKYSLPIRGRLYPSHYSLLYYCKGEKPTTFHPDRLPMPVCPHCTGDLKDYGGYKNKMNPHGVNLSDVWLDIPPVRHAKYKKRNSSNELSVKLLDRIIEMASDESDLVFDPFGGSGTTYAVAEIKNRKWIGIEIGPVDDIIDRIKNIKNDLHYLEKFRPDLNCLFTNKNLIKRNKDGQWTPDSVRRNASV
jgi:site-specific DNA-methyltransferase (adenine-specific)